MRNPTPIDSLKLPLSPVPWLLILSAVALSGCGGLADMIQGRVEADVAGHHVVVTDCYRTSPPSPEKLAEANGVPVYRFAPCKDAIVMLRGAELQVNDVAYGTLGAGDEIVVDHGRVSINRKSGS